MKEDKLQKDIMKYLQNQTDIDYYNRITQARFSGFPDLLVVKNGITYYFELKKEIGGRISEIQKLNIKLLNKNKKIAYIITNIDQIKKILES